MTKQEIEESGCPFRKVFCAEQYCKCSPHGMQVVTGFVMCEVDWESCPDYIKATTKEGAKTNA